ncbi:MAG: NAD(P)-dependent glycerol-3-phosphate dehydrogenase, partial [Gemmatimonadales bacterium]
MRIAVIGAGSWGTALANLLAGKGLDVTLWAYEQELVERLAESHVNDLFLPEVALDRRLHFTNDLATAVSGRLLVVLASPSQVMRSVVRQLQPHLAADSLLVSAAKGIENDTLLLMSEVLEEELGLAANVRSAYLSGPSFAREVAAGLPTAVTVAALEPEVGRRVQELFHTDVFRVYTNADVVGVELGGALKNVIALAAGVSDGLGFGHNARAALINRGLVEMARLGAAKGAEA